MMRATLQTVLDSRIPGALGLCGSDVTAVAGYVNEAVQTLVLRGRWHGTYQRYAVCVNNGCLTWPRQVAAIESVAVNGAPMKIRNQWFEFLEGGIGLRDENSCDLELLDRGWGPTFDDAAGDGSELLRAWSSWDEDVTCCINVQGYDENNQWVQTEENGVVVEGENMLVGTVKTTGTKRFTAITGVQKPESRGPVWLAGYNPDTTVERVIGYYENDERLPWYRKSYVPGLLDVAPVSGSCEKRVVTVMAKMEFVPVRRATDWVMIGNLPALKEMCLAIKYRESQDVQRAQEAEVRAVDLLQAELGHYEGAGVVMPVNMESETFGAGNIAEVW